MLKRPTYTNRGAVLQEAGTGDVVSDGDRDTASANRDRDAITCNTDAGPPHT